MTTEEIRAKSVKEAIARKDARAKLKLSRDHIDYYRNYLRELKKFFAKEKLNVGQYFKLEREIKEITTYIDSL
jgi:hypothetical protein